jgi:orotate phosphoribosyltransferase
MISQEIARTLLKEKAVFLRPHDPFTWTSGIRSPVYCDNRLLISTVKPREMIVDAFCAEIKKLNVDVISGTATAGIPWAAFVAQKLGLPMVYVRSSSKDHGRQNAIEGKASRGMKTVLMEDLISTGKSSIAAGRKLQEEGVEVVKVFSLFTYGFAEADRVFKDAGFACQSLTNFDILAQVAFEDQMLDKATLDEVLNWRKSVTFP